MNKENISASTVGKSQPRITRARAKDLGTLAGQVQKPPRPEPSRAPRANLKRVASDENTSTAVSASLPKKRRATLVDVTNVLCEQSYTACFTSGKFQKDNQAKKGLIRKNKKVTPTVPVSNLHDRDDVKDKIAGDISKLTVETQDVTSWNNPKPTWQRHKDITIEENLPADHILGGQGTTLMVPPSFGEEDRHHVKAEVSKDPSVVDIDLNQKDPLMCSLYASDIYEHKRVTELNQKSSFGYMEKVQRYITPSMRGILVDWLVEVSVSDEYKLVPDTLYLTVNLIDRYLSGNYIEKQRLQLLGVTCMLIASKYEEMSAPQVQDFCFITANTYAKEEVLKMEREVLNYLCFQLCVPTIKTFLRRFIHAAQATSKVSSVNLEFMANFLAELTLVEYSFLKFRPSLIAASAVFLARWTVDQSVHPWNSTLEHYTGYKATELEETVIAMQDLQLNTIKSPLNAVREKYRQEKYKCVANLSPPEPVQSLF